MTLCKQTADVVFRLSIYEISVLPDCLEVIVAVLVPSAVGRTSSSTNIKCTFSHILVFQE